MLWQSPHYCKRTEQKATRNRQAKLMIGNYPCHHLINLCASFMGGYGYLCATFTRGHKSVPTLRRPYPDLLRSCEYPRHRHSRALLAGIQRATADRAIFTGASKLCLANQAKAAGFPTKAFGNDRGRGQLVWGRLSVCYQWWAGRPPYAVLQSHFVTANAGRFANHSPCPVVLRHHRIR